LAEKKSRPDANGLGGEGFIVTVIMAARAGQFKTLGRGLCASSFDPATISREHRFKNVIA